MSGGDSGGRRGPAHRAGEDQGARGEESSEHRDQGLGRAPAPPTVRPRGPSWPGRPSSPCMAMILSLTRKPGARGEAAAKGSCDGCDRGAGCTHPNAWLPTLAAGPGQPCSRVPLDINRTRG